ncbi:MAG: sulfide/dihydroorotate dehydrogenase-like FAD/NAD-binding protein [Candidatus Hadarchaeota archaeon]
MSGEKMYAIVSKKDLAPNIKQLEITAAQVASKARPGQFVVLRTHEQGERVPLTIQDWSLERGTVSVVVLGAGKTTQQLNALKKGDRLSNFIGPLGKPTDIEKFGTVVCVGGGVGIASIYPIARALKESGNRVISIIGAKTAELLIFEEEIKGFSDELHIATDDGSKGQHGFVSGVLKKLIDEGRSLDRVIAVGPTLMMKAVAEVTRPKGIKTIVSLNPIMVDGTGMCGSCRVEVGGKTRFACVDGPEFDAHLVNFDQLNVRNLRFVPDEKHSLERCRIQESGEKK